MMNTSNTVVRLAAIAALIGPLSGGFVVQKNNVAGGTLFYDDFSDGNHADGSPVTWYASELSSGDLDATTGEFVLSRNQDSDPLHAVVADAQDVVLSDVSIRAEAKPLETNSFAGLVVRTQDLEDTLGYFAGVAHSPAFGGSGSAVVAGVSLANNEPRFFSSTAGNLFPRLPYDARDVFSQVQIDVFGDEIKVWAWPTGGPMPDEPQFVVTDTTYTEPGHTRVAATYVNPSLATGGAAVVRSVHVADMPIHELPPEISLQAGDADQDLDFDQIDLVQVQIAAKYLTGDAATWGEGDWNGAPSGSPGNPPNGDSLFNQLDIIAALAPSHYLAGPYSAVLPGGHPDDGQASIVYNTTTGELAVDAPARTELTSINIDSTSHIFTGGAAQNLGGSFDNDADNNIFKIAIGGSFGSLSLGQFAPLGFSEEFLLGDLQVKGSLQGGGVLGEVDLVYVPEPSTSVLTLLVALLGFVLFRQTQRLL